MSTTQVLTNDRYEQLRAIGDDLAKTGRRVWLAGLGAVGTAGEAGRKLAADLVERGRKLERNELRTGGERLKNLGRESAAKVRDLGREAERRFEARVAEAMRRFGVPSRDDVRQLIDRIEELNRKIETLSAKS